MKEVVCFSGGVDSLIAWYRVGRPDLLYVELGHKYFQLETLAIEELCQFDREIRTRLKKDKALFRVGETWELPDAEIPARNLLIAIAAARLGYDKIYLVAQQDERSIPDRSEGFFLEASKMLSSLFRREIRLDPVFPDMDKTDMIEWFLSDASDSSEKEFRIELIKKTVACYKPVSHGENYNSVLPPRQCGNCPACFRRAIALTLNGVEEEYNTDPWTTSVAWDYYNRATEGGYSPKRCNRILDALKLNGVLGSDGPW